MQPQHNCFSATKTLEMKTMTTCESDCSNKLALGCFHGSETVASNVNKLSQAWPPKLNPCCVSFSLCHCKLICCPPESFCLLVLLITHSHTDYESIACNLIDLFSRLTERLKNIFISSLFLYCCYIIYLTFLQHKYCPLCFAQMYLDV